MISVCSIHTGESSQNIASLRFFRWIVLSLNPVPGGALWRIHFSPLMGVYVYVMICVMQRDRLNCETGSTYLSFTQLPHSVHAILMKSTDHSDHTTNYGVQYILVDKISYLYRHPNQWQRNIYVFVVLLIVNVLKNVLEILCKTTLTTL